MLSSQPGGRPPCFCGPSVPPPPVRVLPLSSTLVPIFLTTVETLCESGTVSVFPAGGTGAWTGPSAGVLKEWTVTGPIQDGCGDDAG